MGLRAAFRSREATESAVVLGSRAAFRERFGRRRPVPKQKTQEVDGVADVAENPVVVIDVTGCETRGRISQEKKIIEQEQYV